MGEAVVENKWFRLRDELMDVGEARVRTDIIRRIHYMEI